MKCPICGSSISSQKNICLICGYEFKKLEKNNSDYKKKDNKSLDSEKVEESYVERHEEMVVNRAPIDRKAIEKETLVTEIPLTIKKKDDYNTLADIEYKKFNGKKTLYLCVIIGVAIVVFGGIGILWGINKRNDEKEHGMYENQVKDLSISTESEAKVVENDTTTMKQDVSNFQMENSTESGTDYSEISETEKSDIDFESLEKELGEDDEHSIVAYLLYLASTKELSEDDIKGFSSFELSAARNAIYATYGYVFKTEEWNSFFEEYDWYIPNPEVGQDAATPLETKNATFIRKYEEAHFGGVYNFKNVE